MDEVLDGEHDVAGRGLDGEVADFGDEGLAALPHQLAEFLAGAPCPFVEAEVGERAGVPGVGQLDVALCLRLDAEGVLPLDEAWPLGMA